MLCQTALHLNWSALQTADSKMAIRSWDFYATEVIALNAVRRIYTTSMVVGELSRSRTLCKCAWYGISNVLNGLKTLTAMEA